MECHFSRFRRSIKSLYCAGKAALPSSLISTSFIVSTTRFQASEDKNPSQVDDDCLRRNVLSIFPPQLTDLSERDRYCLEKAQRTVSSFSPAPFLLCNVRHCLGTCAIEFDLFFPQNSSSHWIDETLTILFRLSLVKLISNTIWLILNTLTLFWTQNTFRAFVDGFLDCGINFRVSLRDVDSREFLSGV